MGPGQAQRSQKQKGDWARPVFRRLEVKCQMYANLGDEVLGKKTTSAPF